jgi:hypothetical protein
MQYISQVGGWSAYSPPTSGMVAHSEAVAAPGPDHLLRRRERYYVSRMRVGTGANARAAAPDWLDRIQRVALWAGAFGAIGIYLSLFRHALVDDAYITLQWARTLADSGTWGFYPQLTANSQTSPLNALLLAGLYKATGDPVIAAFLLATASCVVMLGVLLRLSRELLKTPWPGALAFVAVLVNPLLISTVGMESLPQAAGLCFLLLCARRSWSVRAALTSAALTLIRPDGVVFLLATIFAMPACRRARPLLAYVVAVAPWFLFSWLALGSLVPDTLFLKMSEVHGGWEGATYATGPLLYFHRLPWLTAAIIAPLVPAIALAAVAPIPDRAIGRFIAAACIAHVLGYALLRVPPLHWYYAPEVVLLTIASALRLGVLLGRMGRPKRRDAALAAGMAVVALPLLAWAAERDFRIDQAPVTTNLATAEQYRTMAERIGQRHPGAVVEVNGEVGTLGYHCDCRIANVYTDPGRVDEGLRRIDWLPMRFNLLFRVWRDPLPASLVLAHAARCPADTVDEWQTSTEWNAVSWCLRAGR